MHEHVLINHRGVGIAIYCNRVVLCATSSNLSSCIACMCCRMSSSIKHVWAFPDLSSRCGHRSLFQSCCCWCYVIQPVHHILHECVVGCPILSSMYDHVPIYLQLHVSSWTVHLHTFLLSLHSNFSPSRPLQLWFEAPCETSFTGHIYAMQSTPKSRRGRYCFIQFVKLWNCFTVRYTYELSHVVDCTCIEDQVELRNT